MRKTRALAALAVSSALVLAACGGDDEASDDATAAAPTITTESGLTITGEPGEKPEVEIPEAEAPADLVVEVLEEGDGPKVEKGDWLVTDYLGQTWDQRDGEDFVFDNSWDRGAPAGFVIGEERVIKGWDDGLVGLNTGTRAALTIPADQAYAQVEDSDLNKDTLVFVVDILTTVDPTATASGEKVSGLPDGLPTVRANKKGVPEVDLADAAEPDESDATLVVSGDGEEIGDGVIVNFIEATYPDGADARNSWSEGTPSVLPSSSFANIAGLEEALDGQKVGSRIVARISGEENVDAEGNPGNAVVVVLDIIGTYTQA